MTARTEDQIALAPENFLQALILSWMEHDVIVLDSRLRSFRDKRGQDRNLIYYLPWLMDPMGAAGCSLAQSRAPIPSSSCPQCPRVPVPDCQCPALVPSTYGGAPPLPSTHHSVILPGHAGHPPQIHKPASRSLFLEPIVFSSPLYHRMNCLSSLGSL
jgi:hypothetical protein